VSSQAYFIGDGWVFINTLNNQPLSLWALAYPWWDHLYPGEVLLSWILFTLFGVAWLPVQVLMAVTAAGVALAVTKLIDTITGRRSLNVAVGTFAALTLPVLAQSSYYMATLAPIIPNLMGLVCLVFATWWMASRRIRWFVAALVAYGVALAFSETSLLFSVLAVAWATLVVDARLPWRERWMSLWQRWPLWTGIAGLSIAHLAVYLTGPYGTLVSTFQPVLALKSFVRTLVLVTGPGLFGLVPDALTWLPELGGWATGAVAWAVIALLAVVSCRNSKPVRSTWLFFAVAQVVVIAPAAVGRSGFYGLEVATNQRYYVVSILLGLVTLALAGRGVPPSWPRRRRLWRPVGFATPIALWTVCVSTALVWPAVASSGYPWTYHRYAAGYNSRQWLANLEATWPVGEVRLVDIPYESGEITHPGLYVFPYNLSSRLVGHIHPEAEWTADPEGAWYVAESGVVTPVALDVVASQSVEVCLTAGDEVAVSFAGQTAPFVAAAYEAEADGGLIIRAQRSGESLRSANGLNDSVAVRAGEHVLVTFVHVPETVTEFVFSVETGRVCLETVSLGELAPG
jgi:hypothetical protein